jgi:hypothetical protein
VAFPFLGPLPHPGSSSPFLAISKQSGICIQYSTVRVEFTVREAAILAASFVQNGPSMIRKYAGDFGLWTFKRSCLPVERPQEGHIFKQCAKTQIFGGSRQVGNFALL